MAMALLGLVFLIALSYVASTASNGYISAYYHERAYMSSFIKEVQDISAGWNITSARGEFQPFSASSSWGFRTSKVSISNMRISTVLINYKNFRSIKISEHESDQSYVVTVQGSGVFTLEMEYDYEYTNYLSGKGKGDATIRTNSSTIEKVYKINANTTERSIESKIRLVFNDVNQITLKGDYKDDSHVQTLMREAFHLEFNSGDFKELNERFEAEFNNFYSNPYRGAYTVNMTSPDILESVIFTKQSVPKIVNNRTGVVLYYDVDVINIPKLSFRTSKVYWDSFDTTLGDYQVFFSQDIIQDILARSSSEARMNFNLFDKDVPPVSLIVNSLAQVCPDFASSRPADEQLRINGYFTNFRVHTLESQFKVTATINFYVYSALNSDKLIEFTANVSSDMQFDQNDKGQLNFILDGPSGNPFTINDIIFNSACNDYKRNPLQTYLLTSMNYLNLNFAHGNRYQLFEIGLKFGDLFKNIKEIRYVAENGFLIIGEPKDYTQVQTKLEALFAPREMLRFLK